MGIGLKDVVYGAAVGDALGVPWEFLARGSFECTDMASGGYHNQPKGTFSDDTSLMLATCDSIRELGMIDTQDMLDRFRAWKNYGAFAVGGVVFDIGTTTSRALAYGRGEDSPYSNGNGSLMRIAPLAFVDASDDQVRAVSAITHAHRTSTESCVVFIRLLKAVLDGETLEEALIHCAPDAGELAFLADVPAWPRKKVRSGGYVIDTLSAALWCAANTQSYAACVLEAVNLGDDSDTTACVAGALAGALYGYGQIPAKWILELRGKDIIESCLF